MPYRITSHSRIPNVLQPVKRQHWRSISADNPCNLKREQSVIRIIDVWMVPTVDALKITLGRAYINFDEFKTILTEVEAPGISRPLTCISDRYRIVCIVLHLC